MKPDEVPAVIFCRLWLSLRVRWYARTIPFRNGNYFLRALSVGARRVRHTTTPDEWGMSRRPTSETYPESQDEWDISRHRRVRHFQTPDEWDVPLRPASEVYPVARRLRHILTLVLDVWHTPDTVARGVKHCSSSVYEKPDLSSAWLESLIKNIQMTFCIPVKPFCMDYCRIIVDSKSPF